MAIRSNQDHWIHGNGEDALILTIVATIFLAFFVFEHVWH
jgi:hypothetical protein